MACATNAVRAETRKPEQFNSCFGQRASKGTASISGTTSTAHGGLYFCLTPKLSDSPLKLDEQFAALRAIRCSAWLGGMVFPQIG